MSTHEPSQSPPPLSTSFSPHPCLRRRPHPGSDERARSESSSASQAYLRLEAEAFALATSLTLSSHGHGHGTLAHPILAAPHLGTCNREASAQRAARAQCLYDTPHDASAPRARAADRCLLSRVPTPAGCERRRRRQLRSGGIVADLAEPLGWHGLSDVGRRAAWAHGLARTGILAAAVSQCVQVKLPLRSRDVVAPSAAGRGRGGPQRPFGANGVTQVRQLVSGVQACSSPPVCPRDQRSAQLRLAL